MTAAAVVVAGVVRSLGQSPSAAAAAAARRRRRSWERDGPMAGSQLGRDAVQRNS